MTKWQAKTINQRDAFYQKVMAVCQGDDYDTAEAAIEALKAAVPGVAIAIRTTKASKQRRAA